MKRYTVCKGALQTKAGDGEAGHWWDMKCVLNKLCEDTEVGVGEGACDRDCLA